MKKNNHGSSLIMAVLLILIMVLVVFLAYEVFYEDILDVLTEGKSNVIDIENTITANHKNSNANKGSSVQTTTPITNETTYSAPQTVNLSNHYYYEQLDEPGKMIYKGLEDNIANMQSGNYTIDFGTKFNDLLNSEGGDKKLNIAFQSAWNAFTYDYVDIFYIDVTKLILTTKTTKIATYARHKVNISSGTNENYFEEGIRSSQDVQAKKNYLSNVRQTIVSQLQGYSDYDKVKYLHNWMVDNIKYDTTYKREDIHNVYGAFKNKIVVCEGYARAFKYILDGLGIESVLISGSATNSSGDTENHAWNYVKLDGKWYAVDVTWDDPVITGGGELTNELRYQYFLKGSYEFFKNHEEDGYLSSNSMKFKFPILEKSDYE